MADFSALLCEEIEAVFFRAMGMKPRRISIKDDRIEAEYDYGGALSFTALDTLARGLRTVNIAVSSYSVGGGCDTCGYGGGTEMEIVALPGDPPPGMEEA